MIEVVLCKIWGSQFIEINRNRCREEINTFVILLCLSNKLRTKRIKNRKSEIGPSNCIYSSRMCTEIYRTLLASRNIVGEISIDTYEVSFADFWGSVDLPNL